jgi:membrane associated rhomboid family serine protease
MAIPTHYDDTDRPRVTRSVQVIIAINIAMLFLQWAVVSDADAFAVLGFQAGSLQRTLWSAVTYMFVHYSALHLALNMYALLAFGPRLEAAMGTRAFTLYYLWCGLGGAVAHMLFIQQGLLIGASAGVLGVMFAYWQQWPDEQVSLFGVVPVRPWTAIVLLGAAILALAAHGSRTRRTSAESRSRGSTCGRHRRRASSGCGSGSPRRRTIRRTRHRARSRAPYRARERSATRWTRSWRRARRWRHSSSVL